MMRSNHFSQRGVSLIEALVAFAIMGFGMLGVLGMQANLRGSSDLSRQRAEAVRIAQDVMEEWRGFSTLVAPSGSGRSGFTDIVTASDETVTGTNAVYTIKRTVPTPTIATGTIAPQGRTLVVGVEWKDRTDQLQKVRLMSVVAGIEPELTGSIVLAANPDAVISPGGRFRGIPSSAVPLGVGTSGFVPPGQAGHGTNVAWVFNNTSGVITICTTSGTTSADLLVTAPVCGTNRALLLSGAVRFDTNSFAPTTTSIADPNGPVFPAFGLGVVQTAPTSQTVACFEDPLNAGRVLFYCAIPVATSTTTPPSWAGRLAFTTPLAIAATTAGNSPSEFKVCRYFAAATYSGVNTALLNQNFALIKAGDGAGAFSCPAGSPQVTWPHQPV